MTWNFLLSAFLNLDHVKNSVRYTNTLYLPTYTITLKRNGSKTLNCHLKSEGFAMSKVINQIPRQA